MTVTLREVIQEDLPIFFEHQMDAEATRMAAFPSRDRDAFMAHWARIMSKETNETGILNTILADDTVAGNVVYWEAAGEPNIAYWLGKTHWGKGIARRGVDLISDVLPFGRLWYGGSNAVGNAIGYATHRSRSHDAVIRVYDATGNVIETHEHTGSVVERLRKFTSFRLLSSSLPIELSSVAKASFVPLV
jgi:hypothetical protein